jgi:hypothetical protein
MNIPASDTFDLYGRLVTEAGERLDDQLKRIRKDETAGEITVRESADERIACMEEHLARLRELRGRYFGQPEPAPDPLLADHYPDWTFSRSPFGCCAEIRTAGGGFAYICAKTPAELAKRLAAESGGGS